MTADSEDNAHEPEGMPPLTYMDYIEFRRLLRMLDIQQHLNLSAHLYSSFLISRLTQGRLPHRQWSAWPLADAPVPPQIFDAFPADDLGPVRRADLQRLRMRARETFPVPPDPEMDAPQVLLRACEEVLQRTVHQRIQNEVGLDVESILEPEPALGGALGQTIVATVEKYVNRVPPDSKRRGLVSWQHLGIQGPAAKRLRRLFNRDLSDFDDHVDDHLDDESSVYDGEEYKARGPAGGDGLRGDGARSGSRRSHNSSGGSSDSTGDENSDDNGDSQSDSQSNAQSDSQSDNQSDSQSDNQSDSQSGSQSDSKSDSDEDASMGARAFAHSDGRRDSGWTRAGAHSSSASSAGSASDDGDSSFGSRAAPR